MTSTTSAPPQAEPAQVPFMNFNTYGDPPFLTPLALAEHQPATQQQTSSSSPPPSSSSVSQQTLHQQSLKFEAGESVAVPPQNQLQTSPSTTTTISQQQTTTNNDDDDDEANSNGRNSNGKLSTRFKWTKEKSQVAMNLVKHGCKPKLVSIAVGCSLRTAQKFVETVTPKMEGESYKNYVIRRRGRKSKDVNERLEAIREVLSKDSTKTQVEIAADLKVSNTTVCRDLKKIKGTTVKTTTTTTRSGKQHSTKKPNTSR